MADPSAHHIGITVRDLDVATEFYRSVFDCETIAAFSVDGDAFATGVDIDDARAEFVHLDLGSVRLELVAYEPTGDDRLPAALNNAGATHLGVTVDNVDEFYASLPESVSTLSPPQTTATGTTICFLRDPDDTLIEVLNPDAGGNES